jgi:hypothetical protein
MIWDLLAVVGVVLIIGVLATISWQVAAGAAGIAMLVVGLVGARKQALDRARVQPQDRKGTDT